MDWLLWKYLLWLHLVTSVIGSVFKTVIIYYY